MVGVGSQTHRENSWFCKGRGPVIFSPHFSEMEQGLWAFGSLFRHRVLLAQWDVASGRARGVWTLSVTWRGCGPATTSNYYHRIDLQRQPGVGF